MSKSSCLVAPTSYKRTALQLDLPGVERERRAECPKLFPSAIISTGVDQMYSSSEKHGVHNAPLVDDYERHSGESVGGGAIHTAIIAASDSTAVDPDLVVCSRTTLLPGCHSDSSIPSEVQLDTSGSQHRTFEKKQKKHWASLEKTNINKISLLFVDELMFCFSPVQVNGVQPVRKVSVSKFQVRSHETKNCKAVYRNRYV